MSSVSGPIQCPQCADEAIHELQTRTMEERVFCPFCGYRAWTTVVIDRQRQAQDPERQRWLKLRKDGKFVHRYTVRPGCGAYVIAAHNGFAETGSFHHPITEAVIVDFRQRIASNPRINPDACLLTRFNQETGQVEAVVGRLETA